MTAVLTLTTVVPVGGQEPEDPSPDAGFFAYSGGPVRAKRARTQTAATNFGTIGVWTNLPGATLSYVVPTGTADLFNVAFSAECLKLGGGQLRIRIRHTLNNVVQTNLEPYDGFQTFCSAPTPATHKGNWVRRVGAGSHVLQVQFLNSAGGIGQADDWTFELVVYD